LQSSLFCRMQSLVKRSLERWFIEFLNGSCFDKMDGDTKARDAQRLTEIPKSSSMSRRTFEIFCDQNGYSKPKFWFGLPTNPTWCDEPDHKELVDISRGISNHRTSQNNQFETDRKFHEHIVLQRRTAGATNKNCYRYPNQKPSQLRTPLEKTSSKPTIGLEKAHNKPSHSDAVKVHNYGIANLAKDESCARFRAAPGFRSSRQEAELNPSHALPHLDPRENRAHSAASRIAKQKSPGRAILSLALVTPVVFLLVWGFATKIHFTDQEKMLESEANRLVSEDIGLVNFQSSGASVLLEDLGFEKKSEETESNSVGHNLTASKNWTEMQTSKIGTTENMISWTGLNRDEVAVRETSFDVPRTPGKTPQGEEVLASLVAAAHIAALKKKNLGTDQRVSSHKETQSLKNYEMTNLHEQESLPGPVSLIDNEIWKFKQNVHFDQKEATSDVDFQETVVSTKELLFEPRAYLGRWVTVIGHVMRLAGEYWVQSDDGLRSMLLSIEAVGSDNRDTFVGRITKIDFLSRVKAEIKGRIEMYASNKYMIEATDIVILDEISGR